MMTDISTVLRRAAATRRLWGRDDVCEVLTALRSASDDRVTDWDEDAGEEWARVLEGGAVIGLISAQLPLMILRSSDVVPPLAAAVAPVSIAVEDFDAAELRADREALVEAFPDVLGSMSGVAALIDPDRFSAQDIWYATV